MSKDLMYRSPDSNGQTMNNRLAKSSPEEPEASIAHVRVCEGPGRRRPRLLGNRAIFFFLWAGMVLMSGRAGLVSEWDFNGNANDSVGRNHGKFIGKDGNAIWAQDRCDNPGKALSFSGKGDYVDCGNDASLSFGDGKKDRAFSIEAWVKMNDRSGFVIASKRGEYLLTNNDHLRLYLYDGNTDVGVSKSAGDLAALSADFEMDWMHIVVVYDGSGTADGINFYVNGKRRREAKEGDWGKYTAMRVKGGAFQIGDAVTDGIIDKVRVYNHALTANETLVRYEENLPFQIFFLQKLIDEYGILLRRLSEIHPAGEIYSQSIAAALAGLTADLKVELENSNEDGRLLLSYSGFVDYGRIRNSVDELKKILKSIEEGTVKKEDNCICYVVDPMSGNIRTILPFWRNPIPGIISNTINITACPGEYEPASFVVAALSDLNSLQVKVGDLEKKGSQSRNGSKAGMRKRIVNFFITKSSAEGIIPSSAIDVKIVKCWYQSGNAGRVAIQDKTRRMLIPELLINDDSLVKVDFEKKENYLKLNFPDGNKYLWISDPVWDAATEKKWEAPWRNLDVISIDKFPIRDASVLQPVNIPAGRNQQFWITVKVPDDAKPGMYEGKISLLTPEKEVGALSLKLRLLPFKLSAPYYASSIDYHGFLSDTGTISSCGKNRLQFKKDLENLVAHGVNNCNHYAGITKSNLREVLELRRQSGMDNETLYLWGIIGLGNQSKQEDLEQLKKNVRDVMELVRPYGTKTIYFWGLDEAAGDLLKSQRPAWEVVRAAGGKISAGGGADNIKLMGDIQDLNVRAGPPSAKEAAEWHLYGHRIFCYGNPQCGVENPEIYRRNFGLLLWKNDYDGAQDNAWQATYGFIWNDFDNPNYTGHSMTYPAMDGPINTVQWEGYREAVDDVRYVSTLQETIAAAKKSGSEKLKDCVFTAEEYLRSLKEGDRIDKGDLSAIRSEIIRQIIDLQKKMEQM